MDSASSAERQRIFYLQELVSPLVFLSLLFFFICIIRALGESSFFLRLHLFFYPYYLCNLNETIFSLSSKKRIPKRASGFFNKIKLPEGYFFTVKE